MTNSETEYLLRRARDEAILAIGAEHQAAAAAHHGMAVRYSAKALLELADGPTEAIESVGLAEAAAMPVPSG